MSEGENAEEGESVGGEVERHERNEGDELISVEERPQRLQRDVTRVRRRAYRKSWRGTPPKRQRVVAEEREWLRMEARLAMEEWGQREEETENWEERVGGRVEKAWTGVREWVSS